MNEQWTLGYEKFRTLEISTIGRRTGRRHEVRMRFATGNNRRVYMAT